MIETKGPEVKAKLDEAKVAVYDPLTETFFTYSGGTVIEVLLWDGTVPKIFDLPLDPSVWEEMGTGLDQFMGAAISQWQHENHDGPVPGCLCGQCVEAERGAITEAEYTRADR